MDLPQADNLFDYYEQLEIISYEAIAHRNAVLREMKDRIGEDLAFGIDVSHITELVELHKALLEQTENCLNMIAAHQASRHRAESLPRTPSKGKSRAS